MVIREHISDYEYLIKIPLTNRAIKVTKKRERKFKNNVVQVPDPYFMEDPTLSLHKAYMEERWIIDNEVTFAFVANTFYPGPDGINYGRPNRIEKIEELVTFMQAKLPGSKFIISAEKMTKSSQKDPALRDPSLHTNHLLRRPNLSAALWQDSVWYWSDFRDAAAHNIFEYDPDSTSPHMARGTRTISPPLQSDPVNQRRKKKFYIRTSVPEDRLDKWCRLSFDIRFENGMDALFKLTKNYVFGIDPNVPSETWTINPPSQVVSKKNLKYSNGKVNKNYTWYDEEEKVLHVVVEFHSHQPELLFRFDYDYNTLGDLIVLPGESQDIYGLAVIDNVRFYDNHILDDERDGGVTNKDMWNSLDATAKVADIVPADCWVQVYKFYNWSAPFHKKWIVDHSKAAIANIHDKFHHHPEFAGFFFESDELYAQGWDWDWPLNIPVSLAIATYYAELSKYIYGLNPEYKIWAYGDLLNPYHGGRQHYRGINPKNGGMYGIRGYLESLLVNPNISWVEWGYGTPIPDSVDFWQHPDSLTHWSIGFCRDQGQWQGEESRNFDLLFNQAVSAKSSKLTGCSEFGWSSFQAFNSSGMNETTLKNLLKFSEAYNVLNEIEKIEFIKL